MKEQLSAATSGAKSSSDDVGRLEEQLRDARATLDSERSRLEGQVKQTEAELESARRTADEANRSSDRALETLQGVEKERNSLMEHVQTLLASSKAMEARLEEAERARDGQRREGGRGAHAPRMRPPTSWWPSETACSRR